MQFEEAQAEQKAEDTVYDTTASFIGEKISGKAVPQHRWESWVLLVASPDRDPGKREW